MHQRRARDLGLQPVHEALRTQHRRREQRQADIHDLRRAAELLLGIFAGLNACVIAGVVVADGDEGRHALDRVALEHDGHPLLLGAAQQRNDGVLVDRRDDQNVDALGHEVLGGGDLLGRVEIGILDLDGDAELGAAILHALDDVLVPLMRRIIDDVADLLRRGLGIGRADRQHRDGGSGEKSQQHLLHVAFLPCQRTALCGRLNVSALPRRGAGWPCSCRPARARPARARSRSPRRGSSPARFRG